MRSIAVVLAALAAASTASAATLEVGPGKTYAKPCDAIGAAKPGDTIEVDGAGSYDGDTCAWTTDMLTVKGVNGRPRIDLTGVTPDQQKGIFNISADHATLENFELSGAAIDGGSGPGDSNGAGIRHQGLSLTVKDCFIHDNQDGILGAPLTPNTGSVVIDNTELANNGEGDGYTHNAYLGDYATVTIQYSYSHHSNVGHLFKSRAYVTFVLYNRLSDEAGGTGSYELDLPNAGTAYVIGNVLEQSAASQNPNIVAFGEEGQPSGYDAHLYFVANTVVNDLMSGTFVDNETTTPALLEDDIFYGGGTVHSNAKDQVVAVFDTGDPKFVDVSTLDVHLSPGSPCIDQGVDPGKAGSFSLSPRFEYVQPVGSEARAVVGKAIDIGAYEFGLPDGGAAEDGGAGADAGGHGADGGARDGGAAAGDGAARDSGAAGPGGGDAGASGGSSSGCGCRVGGGARDRSPWPWLALPALVGLALRRRRVK